MHDSLRDYCAIQFTLSFFSVLQYNMRLMRILVIEDDHKIANSIKKGLQQEAYVVDLAFDGSVGVDLGGRGFFKKIFLDLMFCDMGGLEVC